MKEKEQKYIYPGQAIILFGVITVKIRTTESNCYLECLLDSSMPLNVGL